MLQSKAAVALNAQKPRFAEMAVGLGLPSLIPWKGLAESLWKGLYDMVAHNRKGMD